MKDKRVLIAIIMAVTLLIPILPAMSLASVATPVSVIEEPSNNISLSTGTAEQVAVVMKLSNDQLVNITQDCTWTSSDTSVVSLLADGVIDAVCQGQATITATISYPGYSGSSAQFSVSVGSNGTNGTVSNPFIASTTQPIPKSLSVYPSSLSLNAGSAQQVQAIMQYSNGQSFNVSQNCIWQSSNSSVASIIGDGVIDAVYQGTATIDVSVSADVYNTPELFSSSFNVTVSNNTSTGSTVVSTTPPSGVTAASMTADPSSNLNLNVGSAQQAEALIKLSNGEVVNVSSLCTWSSNNTSIASLMGNGVIKGVSDGTATVTATVNGYDGTYTASIPFTVTVNG